MLWALWPIGDSFPGLLRFYLLVVLACFVFSLPILLRWWGGFLSLWPNKSGSCQRERERKKKGFEFPLFAVLRSPAVLHSVFHPHGAAAKLRITSGEVGQSETEMINFYWHIASCCVSDTRPSLGDFNQAFSLHRIFTASSNPFIIMFQRTRGTCYYHSTSDVDTVSTTATGNWTLRISRLLPIRYRGTSERRWCSWRRLKRKRRAAGRTRLGTKPSLFGDSL